MLHVYSFPPIASRSARVLILGTMPGRVSARTPVLRPSAESFWRIVGGILGFDPAIPYAARVALVQSAASRSGMC